MQKSAYCTQFRNLHCMCDRQVCANVRIIADNDIALFMQKSELQLNTIFVLLIQYYYFSLRVVSHPSCLCFQSVI